MAFTVLLFLSNLIWLELPEITAELQPYFSHSPLEVFAAPKNHFGTSAIEVCPFFLTYSNTSTWSWN